MSGGLINRLTLAPGLRPGSGTQREVAYEDFVVDGKSLRDFVGGDATRLDHAHPVGAVDALRKLLGEEQPDFPQNRVALYVCGECGDYGCGTSTARVRVLGDRVTWDVFGWQTNYDPAVVQPEQWESPSFTFDRGAYETLLRDALARFEDRRTSTGGDVP